MCTLNLECLYLSPLRFFPLLSVVLLGNRVLCWLWYGFWTGSYFVIKLPFVIPGKCLLSNKWLAVIFAACRFLCISDGLSPLSSREWAYSSALHMPIGVSLSSLGMGLRLAISFPLNLEATQISSPLKIHYNINYVQHCNDLCFPLALNGNSESINFHMWHFPWVKRILEAS